MLNIPTLITLFRIFSIPFVMIFIYFDFWVGDYIAAFLFGIACFSDYLDGHFARTMNQISPIGTFLDPIADKLLITATLLILISIGRIEGYSLFPATMIIMREIFVAGLREYLSTVKISVRVSYLAKWKTAAQMGALVCLILNSTTFFGLDMEEIGLFLLWFSAGLTSLTAYNYWNATVKNMSFSKKF